MGRWFLWLSMRFRSFHQPFYIETNCIKVYSLFILCFWTKSFMVFWHTWRFECKTDEVRTINLIDLVRYFDLVEFSWIFVMMTLIVLRAGQRHLDVMQIPTHLEQSSYHWDVNEVKRLHSNQLRFQQGWEFQLEL